MTTTLRRMEVDSIAEIAWQLCEHRGKPEARAAVLPLVTQLVGAEHAASFVWDARTHRSTRRCAVNIDEQWLDAYDSYFHEIDLITPALRSVARATNVDRVVQRSHLLDSEFYRDFLQPMGLHHGINVYFFDQGRDLGDFRIWRSPNDPPFAEREERILDELTPYFVKSLVNRSACSAKLSQRESDVAQLVAGGASDKQVARQLGIAYTTVRTHLNSAMDKLDCANRTQLSRYF